jgi:predicted nuclease of predicted toxin-antitoxin system
MRWAAEHEHIVFTHDLDFGTTLALTHAIEPSVIQVRGAGVMPDQIGSIVLAALAQYDVELTSGAIVVVEPGSSRVRVLPF